MVSLNIAHILHWLFNFVVKSANFDKLQYEGLNILIHLYNSFLIKIKADSVQ